MDSNIALKTQIKGTLYKIHPLGKGYFSQTQIDQGLCSLIIVINSANGVKSAAARLSSFGSQPNPIFASRGSFSIIHSMNLTLFYIRVYLGQGSFYRGSKKSECLHRYLSLGICPEIRPIYVLSNFDGSKNDMWDRQDCVWFRLTLIHSCNVTG